MDPMIQRHDEDMVLPPEVSRWLNDHYDCFYLIGFNCNGEYADIWKSLNPMHKTALMDSMRRTVLLNQPASTPD
jgi:hypothetical protein